MKQALLLLLPFALLGCYEQPTPFEKIECSPSDSIPNSNLRKIFEPCKEYIYSAKYWDAEYNLISQEKIWLMATGHAWAYQPELQDEILIQYSFDSSRVEHIKQFNINGELDKWTTMTTTGIIENNQKTSIHPFRQNQYSFTQVAPFPDVSHPLYEGKVWSVKFNIHEGWGVWTNSTLDQNYSVIGYETVSIEFGELEAWHVSSMTTTEFGTLTHHFWYNEEFGFIKMIIKNYVGQLLQFELAEVKKPM
ncbi:MAG: hypothetical protein ACJAUJ_001022 [Salibacteraceae bacterium]|jgi:hypothetical protein